MSSEKIFIPKVCDSSYDFPNPYNAPKNLPLAWGGDLNPDRLLLAYCNGIFPWYNSNEPILWWSPEPRLVLYLNDLKVSKSLKKVIKSNKFEIRVDTNFKKVTTECSRVPRVGQNGTWIQSEIIEAYTTLHQLGYAHSIETYFNGELVGGLYGISLGKTFFGESMFSKMSDASKVALVKLVEKLKEWDFDFIDCQSTTNHLKSLGAIEIDRTKFLNELKVSLNKNSHFGNWTL